jgi:hypothetical protein
MCVCVCVCVCVCLIRLRIGYFVTQWTDFTKTYFAVSMSSFHVPYVDVIQFRPAPTAFLFQFEETHKYTAVIKTIILQNVTKIVKPCRNYW